MAVKIYLATQKIWDHFFKNIDRMRHEEDLIAENKELDKALYLTCDTYFPQFILYHNNQPLIWRPVRNREECNASAVYMITKYLIGEDAYPDATASQHNNKSNLKIIDTQKVEDESAEEKEDDPEQAMLDAIYEREDQLAKAMGDLLATVLIEDDYNAVVEAYGTKMLNEIVDDFCQYLYDTHMISVYRPTILVDTETELEEYVEFPYGCDSETG